MHSKEWRPLITKLYYILVSLLVSCSGEEEKSQVNGHAIRVRTVESRAENVQIEKEWVGTLDGMENAHIRAQVTGYLIARDYQEGQFVRKDAVLFRIDPRTFETDLDKAKAKLAYEQAQFTAAKLELGRVENLLPERAVSIKNRDDARSKVTQAQAQVDRARAELKSAQISLDFTKIRSPISGTAGISVAQIGELVGPGSASKEVMTIVSQTDPMRAYIQISEIDYLSIVREYYEKKIEPNIVVTLADGSLYPHVGRLLFSDRGINELTGTIKVVAQIDNPNHLLKPGQFVRLKLPIRIIKEAILIPQSAVISIQGVSMIAVVADDGRVSLRQVSLGDTYGEDQIITNGLSKGEKVVYSGAQKLTDGVQVIEIKTGSKE